MLIFKKVTLDYYTEFFFSLDISQSILTDDSPTQQKHLVTIFPNFLMWKF